MRFLHGASAFEMHSACYDAKLLRQGLWEPSSGTPVFNRGFIPTTSVYRRYIGTLDGLGVPSRGPPKSP